MEKVQTELSERKIKILDAIIRNYLESGEPVGSRTISKYTDLKLSSATIRNEMSDLEELGYIVQPHTSAGRIPTDKGYRFYVDHLIREKDREVAEMKEFVLEKTEKMEKVLKNVAKLLAHNTNYATMVSAPSFNHNRIKFIQLSGMNQNQLLAVIVMDSNMVKNHIINVAEPLDSEPLLQLNFLLNTSLNGLSLQEINLGTISRLKEKAGIHSGIIGDVLDTLASSLTEAEELQIYTSGTTNILKYPELCDSESVASLFNAFEEKDELKELITDSLSKDEPGTDIQVYIGNESRAHRMKDCSVVTATYDLGDGIKGTIGIVGPKRMDYEKVMNNLRTLKYQLDGILKKNKDGNTPDPVGGDSPSDL